MTHTLRIATLLVLAASPLFAQSGTPENSVSALPSLIPNCDPARTCDNSSYAAGIDDAGQVVGLINTSTLDDTAVLWDQGKVIPIGGIGLLTDSRARDINERGQVIGDAYRILRVPSCGKAAPRRSWMD